MRSEIGAREGLRFVVLQLYVPYLAVGRDNWEKERMVGSTPMSRYLVQLPTRVSDSNCTVGAVQSSVCHGPGCAWTDVGEAAYDILKICSGLPGCYWIWLEGCKSHR
jgi:hypothetical protein